MSASTPPRPESFGALIERAAAISRFLATLLVTAVALRFAVVGFHHAFGGAEEAAAEHRVSPPHVKSAPPPPSASNLAGLPPEPATASTTPRSYRVTLGVTAGPPRSELYVNGRLVGQTPFFGDLACKETLPIHIQLVPPTGAPIVYERECHGGTIEISGPPP